MSDLRAYAEQVKSRPGAPVEPIPEIKPFESYRYPEHAIDPFDPGLVASALSAQLSQANVTIDPNRPREYLESFPLDTLAMVGTLEREGLVYALVKTKEGTIQRVRVGNYMGQNYGEIIRISEASIMLREIVPDGLGGYMERETKVALGENDKRAN
jgi:type IV pilus assembly protein PilP